MIALLLACTCPEGFVREAGRCEPAGGGGGGPAALPDEASFRDEYADEQCDALEECICEVAEIEDCDLDDLDCVEPTWPLGCTYDPEAARDCLSGRFDCDEAGDSVVVTAPEACAQVYVCDSGG